MGVVPFSKASQDRVPKTQGVYAFAGGPDKRILDGRLYGDLFSVVYVGSANNLRKTWRTLERRPTDMKPALNTFPILQFYFLETPEMVPKQVEQHLINAFGPPVNRIQAVAVDNLEPLNATFGEPKPAQGGD